MKAAGIIACAFFVFAVLLQFNDPDPVPWVIAYGTAAGIALAALLGKEVTWLATAAGAGFAIGALYFSPALGEAPVAELLVAEMKTTTIEEAREALGLAICAGWMAVLAVRGWRARKGR